jgi:hypothetical protein
MVVYLLRDFAFSRGVYYWSVCNSGLIMHFMKSLTPEIWNEQETCTSKQPFVNFQATCFILCFIPQCVSFYVSFLRQNYFAFIEIAFFRMV